MIKIKSEKEILIMAEGGIILANIMEELKKKVKPGITTKELDRAAEALVFKYKAEPSFKGYQGFPSALCVSVNEELVHMPPSDRILKQGDIVSLDLGILYKGFHTDMAITVFAEDLIRDPTSVADRGRVSDADIASNSEALRLIKTTKKALKLGIKKAKIGNTIGDIGNTIQRFVNGQGLGVVKDLCGHGIGRKIHEDPKIPNYGKRHKGAVIKPGMVFCIEPMITIGDWHIKKTKDGFGFQTKDNSLSCHFEHTVAITEKGPKPLTNLP